MIHHCYDDVVDDDGVFVVWRSIDQGWHSSTDKGCHPTIGTTNIHVGVCTEWWDGRRANIRDRFGS
eukprot:scaffold62912_cov59-Attheya_sp.AAC.2